MKTIERRGFQSIILSYVADGWSTGTVFLRFLGPENAVSAIWARLSSSEMRKSGTCGVEIDGSDVRFEKHVRYVTIPPARLPCGFRDIAMLHPRATAKPGEGTFYVLAQQDVEGPPAEFFPRLNARVHLPMLKEWTPWLWERGLAGVWREEPITRLDGTGDVVAYKVLTEQRLWYAIIVAGMGFKVCPTCGKCVWTEDVHGVMVNDGKEDVLICQECYDKTSRWR